MKRDKGELEKVLSDICMNIAIDVTTCNKIYDYAKEKYDVPRGIISDLVCFRPQDIHGNRLKLFDGRELVVSNKLLKYIKESIKETIYYSSSGGQTKVMPLVDKGYVIKSYPNTKEGTSNFAKGRIIYNSISRSLNYVGVLDYMSANSIFESGKIDMIKHRSAELGISAKDYIYSDYIREVEEKYNCKIVKSVFWIKYEDYL